MAKTRSPNYPAIGLTKAVSMARQMWGKENRTPVSLEVAAKAIGFGALSGPARTAMAALKKYGLFSEDGDRNVKLTDIAIRIVHAANDQESLEALREAALRPGLFRELAATHLQASDAALRSHLIAKLQFSETGANQCLEAFRDAMAIAKLEKNGYIPQGEESKGESMNEQTIVNNEVIKRNATQQGRIFSWPLSRGVSAELRLSGGEVKPAHLDLLAKYLEIAKQALEDESKE